jgi:hypothetical protein
MSPVTKLEDLPETTLALTKILQNPSTQGDPSHLSREELMQMIYALLFLVGENMSSIQNSFAKNQLDLSKIAGQQADVSQIQTNEFVQKMQQYEEAQKEAAKWGVLGTVFKWIGVALGTILGALLCETPVGFGILAGVIALTASPLFGKTVDALGAAIGKTCGGEWGKIIAEAILLVAVTVVSCGAEGLSTGVSKVISSATEDVIEDGAQEGVQMARREAEVGIGDFAPKWSSATSSAFTQTLASSNLIGDFLTQIMQYGPGDKKAKQDAAMVLSLIFNALLSVAACKMSTTGGANLLEKLSGLLKDPALLRKGLTTMTGLSQIGTSAGGVGNGYYTYEQGQVQEGLAPIQAGMLYSQEFFQILNRITSLCQEVCKSLMDSNKILFETDFSADFAACVNAQQQA